MGELLFGVEVSSSDLSAEAEEPTVVDRVKNLFLGSSGPPVANELPRQRSRTPFPSMSCLTTVVVFRWTGAALRKAQPRKRLSKRLWRGTTGRSTSISRRRAYDRHITTSSEDRVV